MRTRVIWQFLYAVTSSLAAYLGASIIFLVFYLLLAAGIYYSGEDGSARIPGPDQWVLITGVWAAVLFLVWSVLVLVDRKIQARYSRRVSVLGFAAVAYLLWELVPRVSSALVGIQYAWYLYLFGLGAALLFFGFLTKRYLAKLNAIVGPFNDVQRAFVEETQHLEEWAKDMSTEADGLRRPILQRVLELRKVFELCQEHIQKARDRCDLDHAKRELRGIRSHMNNLAHFIGEEALKSPGNSDHAYFAWIDQISPKAKSYLNSKVEESDT